MDKSLHVVIVLLYLILCCFLDMGETVMPGFCFCAHVVGCLYDDDDDDDDGKINAASCPKRLKSSFPIWF